MDKCPDCQSFWLHYSIVGYHFLRGRVLSIWRPSARVDWLDLGKDFFLFRFESKQDMDNMLASGPWFIRGHYIAICVWEPYFRPSSVEASIIAIWVRLNELPMEFYDPSVLREIGRAICPILKVDVNTTTESREHMRICVQIDINKN